MKDAEKHMKMAIEMAKKGITLGQTPFGAVIIKGDRIIANAHNRVWKSCDPTAHAEVNAIREAAQKLKTIDLAGCEMFTTCEPCPMCLSAIHWSKIDRVLYGATIAHALEANFQELNFSAKELAKRGGSKLIVQEGPCQKECIELFTLWKNAPHSRSY